MSWTVLGAAFSLLIVWPGTSGAAAGKKRCAANHAGSAKAGVGRNCSRRTHHRYGLASLRAVGLPAGDAQAVAALGPRTQEQPGGRRVSALAQCELVVRGPCDIYADEFWEMRARYAAKESAFAEYPASPECAQVCAAVEYYLYPDGTLGSATWAVDPCVAAGWRVLDWPYDGPTCIQEAYFSP